MRPGDTSGQAALARTDFLRLRQLINSRAGLSFDDAAQHMFEKRLGERLIATGVKTFADYIKLVESDAEEADVVYTLLTTKETYFFRQEYQLEAFTKEVLPIVAEANAHHRRLTVWSAGCSTGEEAYTLAILLSEMSLLDGWFLRVLGTDLCRQNIDTANRAVYKGSSFRTTPEHHLKAHFVPQGDGSYKVAEPLRRICHFSRVNLLDHNAVRTVGRVDVVFCRNVIIYFDEYSRQKVMAEVFQRLLPGGYLFLGHSESLLNVETPFVAKQLKGDVAYRRQASIPPAGRLG
jgi:chemotaxis protein methyltransferase CheR